MLIKAAEGARVRDPFTKAILPTVGDDAEPFSADDNDLHYARLLRDGDVVVVTPPAPAKAPKATPPKDDQA